MGNIPQFKQIDAEVDGHQLRLAISGQDRLDLLLETIGEAQSTLRLFFYIFGNDWTAVQVRAALIAARERGVKIWLMVDGFGSATWPDDVFKPLVDAGVYFARFNPRWGRRYLLRNHQKIVVADEARALVGGSNVLDPYFIDNPEGSGWHDLLLRIDGPAAARLARYFDGLRRWTASDRPTLRMLLHIMSRRSDKDGALRWLFNGPFSRLSPLTRSLRQDIATAKRLDMIQAYFAPNWGMLRRLANIERRGGKMRLISAARSDNFATVSAARHCYRRMLRNRVRIYEYQPQMLHVKLIVADNAVYIGSANFDMRSLYINGEIMLRIEDGAFAKRVTGLVDAHVPYCDEISRAEHQAQSTWLARLRWLLAYFVVSTVDFTVTRTISLRRR
ncbi:phospholipase D-like domain-containing protein [Aquisediminimonas profunda]|uniref:phospholipase D-like domain-containing protein n=1 Tax=Aquisediminimonas profunda TaxID=1550733 RepID=UPI001C628B9A|nr:phosphatidylserine/phosphatidylglycerophosphate/cardiolipin synthase family protein [Aquisediminimonas profunda]